MERTASEWLQEARRQAEEGHYLRQLAAARRALELGGPQEPEARVEALSALVWLQRVEEAEAEHARVRVERGPLRIRADAMLGYGLTLVGRLQEAGVLVERACEAAAQSGDARSRYLTSVARSRLDQARDRPVDAVLYGDEGLEQAQLVGPVAVSTMRYHMGYLWLDFGMADRAAAVFDEALDVDGLTAARQAAIHIGAGLAHRALGSYGTAERHVRQAVRLHQSGERTYREGSARLALAETLFDRQQREQAIAEARRAITLFMDAASIPTEMRGRLCLGRLLLAGGEVERGVAELETVLRSPHARALHDEARVVLGELVDHRDHPFVAGLKKVALDPSAASELRARAAFHLGQLSARAADPHDAEAWFRRYGAAQRAIGGREARARHRMLEIREQLAAVRREHQRAEELSEALAEQQRLREAAESAEAERRDLLELVAHDLRNPLSALLLVLDGAEEAADLSEFRELLGLGQRSARAMREVLDDALAASESIGVLGAFEPVALEAIVEGSVRAFEAGARAKCQQLTFRSASVEVEGVSSLLRSVLDNLVSNALKFTPRGGAVEVSLVRAGERARIEVRDDGPGLGDGEAATLFERRVRGRARPTAGEPSTGLGLYLARKVVEGHGGRIGAESEGPGTGSAFWVELPLPS